VRILWTPLNPLCPPEVSCVDLPSLPSHGGCVRDRFALQSLESHVRSHLSLRFCRKSVRWATSRTLCWTFPLNSHDTGTHTLQPPLSNRHPCHDSSRPSSQPHLWRRSQCFHNSSMVIKLIRFSYTRSASPAANPPHAISLPPYNTSLALPALDHDPRIISGRSRIIIRSPRRDQRPIYTLKQRNRNSPHVHHARRAPSKFPHRHPRHTANSPRSPFLHPIRPAQRCARRQRESRSGTRTAVADALVDWLGACVQLLPRWSGG
jgi:hypothetical protein